jgi:hypothetical protein
MDEIMKQNVKLLTTTKFNKDYYRNKYVEAINKIATMTGEIVDLQQQLIASKDDVELIETKNYLKTAHWKINDLEKQLIERTEERDYVSKIVDTKLGQTSAKKEEIIELQAKLIKNQSRLEWLIEENTALRKTVKRLKGLKIKE